MQEDRASLGSRRLNPASKTEGRRRRGGSRAKDAVQQQSGQSYLPALVKQQKTLLLLSLLPRANPESVRTNTQHGGWVATVVCIVSNLGHHSSRKRTVWGQTVASQHYLS